MFAYELSVKYWEDEIKSISEQLLKQRYIGSTQNSGFVEGWALIPRTLGQ